MNIIYRSAFVILEPINVGRGNSMKTGLHTKLRRFCARLLVWTVLVSGLMITPSAEEAAETAASASVESIERRPMIVSEDVSKRGANEKHFLCDDGREGWPPLKNACGVFIPQ